MVRFVDEPGGAPSVYFRHAIFIFTIVVFGATQLFAADMPAASSQSVQSDGGVWATTFDTETRVFSWTSNNAYPAVVGVASGLNAPGRGMQVYVPYALELIGRPNDDFKIETLVRSGYTWARQYSAAAPGEFGSPTDTTVSSTATYYGFNGIQPFLSGKVNAPTGTSALFGGAVNARMDPDIVDAPTFGEGWNYGTTAGVNIPFTKNIVLALSAGYTYRGPYMREGILDPFTGVTSLVRLDPGDDVTLTSDLTIKTGGWKFLMSAIYTHETRTTLDFMDFYRSGESIQFAGSARYAWNDEWSSKLTGSFTHTANNDVFVMGMPALVEEPSNSNSDMTNIKFNTTYSHNAWSVGATAGFLYRDHNEYDLVSLLWLPEKTKYSLGALATYDISKLLSVNARVERMWVHEGAYPVNPLPFGTPPTITDAWLFLVGGTVTF
jgi:hypothetical protein